MKADVTHITDVRELENKTAELLETEADISIDTGPENIGKGTYEFAPSKVCAVLVMERSGDGSVTVTGKGGQVDNVETNPTHAPRKWIIIVKEGQTCAILGRPAFRYFYIGGIK